MGNIPERIRGRKTTGYTLEGDQLQRMFGSGFLIPHYPQIVLKEAGSLYWRVAPDDPYVIRDGKLVTGQNQHTRTAYLHAVSRLLAARCCVPQAKLGTSAVGRWRVQPPWVPR